MSLGNRLPPISFIRIFALSSGHHRSLRKADCMDWVLSQGETKQKRPGLFEPKASFQGAAERALEISQMHAHAGSNAGDGCKKRQSTVKKPVPEKLLPGSVPGLGPGAGGTSREHAAMSFILVIPGVCPRGHWRALLIALGQAQPKRAVV